MTGQRCRTDASKRKVLPKKRATQLVKEAIATLARTYGFVSQVLARGYAVALIAMTPDFQMERHYRDSRVMRIGGDRTAT